MLKREDWIMIRKMRDKGCYLREIAAEAGCSERTVRRALKRGGPPPRRRPGVRPSKLDPCKPWVDQLLSEGVWNAEVIYAELRAQGYRGGRSILRDYIRLSSGCCARRKARCASKPRRASSCSRTGVSLTRWWPASGSGCTLPSTCWATPAASTCGPHPARMPSTPTRAWCGPSSGSVAYPRRCGWTTRKPSSCPMPCTRRQGTLQPRLRAQGLLAPPAPDQGQGRADGALREGKLLPALPGLRESVTPQPAARAVAGGRGR